MKRVKHCFRTASLLAASLYTAPNAAWAQGIVVQPPVAVSPAGAGGHFFGFGNTKADPADSLHLVTCGMRQRASTNSWQGYLYTSHDGGRSWREGLIDSSLAQDSSSAEISEVSCALGLGRTYMVAEAWNPLYFRPRGRPVGVFRLYHSTDGERSWSPPITRGWLDHSRSVVDNTSGGYRGRLYMFGNRRDVPTGLAVRLDTLVTPTADITGQIFARKPLLVSDDGGASVQGPVLPPRYEGYEANYPSEAVVLRDGTVVGVYFSSLKPSGGRKDDWLIEVVASRDGGRTLGSPVAVGRAVEMPNYHATIAAAPAGGRFPDRLYASWAVGTQDRSRVMLASSDDGGRTWSPPRAVDDAPRAGKLSAARGRDAREPSLAVNPTGIVGLTWVERGGTCWRFAASTDGGAAFAPSVALNVCPRAAPTGTQYWTAHLLGAGWPSHSQGPQTSQVGLTVRVDDWAGEGGLAATTDGVFHPTWTVAQSDGALWSARVTVGAPSKPPASLAGLTKVTPRAVLEIAGTSYDGPTDRITADVVVVNNDSTPLVGPLVLALTSMHSSFGAVELVNGDGTARDAEPLIDLTPDLGAGRTAEATLPPGGRSAPHRLVFHVKGLRAAHPKGSPTLLSVTADLYAQR